MSSPHPRQRSAGQVALAGVLLGVVAGVWALFAGAQSASAVSCGPGVWTAQYWANAHLWGTPKKTLCDSMIDENWGYGHPAGIALPNDGFTARWTTRRNFGGGGPFVLTAAGQDGIRVWIDGRQYVDAWHNYATTQTRSVRVSFTTGWHSLRVDYAAFTGRASIRLTLAPATTGDTTAPWRPAGLTATLTDPTVTLSWARNVEADLAYYRVYRSTTYPFALDTAHYRGPTTATTYRDTPPATGARYYYAVVARDRSGNQSRPAVVSIASKDHTPPAAPTGVTASFADPGVRLTWAKNPETDLAGYRVYRRASPTEAWTLLSGDAPIAATTFTDTPALTGATYTYTVTAVDQAGNTSPTPAVTVTLPDRTPPTAPAGLAGTATDHGTDLAWTASSDPDAAGYRLYRALTTPVPLDAAHLVSGDTALTGTTFTDTTVVRAVAYHYALAAVDAAGNASTPVTAAPDPLPAAPPPALHVSGNQLQDAHGNPIVLRGADRSGTEYGCVQGWGVFDGPSDAASVQAMLTWHINAVRVPLNEDCWLGLGNLDPALAGDAYQQAIRDYVTLLHHYGLVAILDLHWNDGTYTGPASACPDAAALCQKPMPDAAHATDFWTAVATAFKDDPATIFDLMNEPYPDQALTDPEAAWTCWRDGHTACTGLGYDAAGMQTLLDAVRTTGATNVVMIPGLTWGNDLSGWLAHRPTDPTGNLAAAWHAYSFNPCTTQDCWDTTIAPVTTQVPLIVGEIGENDCTSSWIDTLTPWLDAHHASYTAWAWDVWPTKCGTGPDLLTSYDGTPTPYGTGYRNHLDTLAP